jgi:hypothetical protein
MKLKIKVKTEHSKHTEETLKEFITVYIQGAMEKEQKARNMQELFQVSHYLVKVADGYHIITDIPVNFPKFMIKRLPVFNETQKKSVEEIKMYLNENGVAFEEVKVE